MPNGRGADLPGDRILKYFINSLSNESIYQTGQSWDMASSSAVARGPTVATLRAVEDVLRRAAVPMSRYGIRKTLGNSIAQPMLDEALDYMADHSLVFDEGPGGKVLWIHAPADVHANLAA
jgi:hypothetical protein